jgi:lysophospholipase L1-like esterase
MTVIIQRVLLSVSIVIACSATVLSQPTLRFRDGDHVVLLGATFIERAQLFGHLEAAFTAATGDHHVTFRNLGWSGDTVFADSRGIFDSPEKGYQRMIAQVRSEEPSVIVICYGQNEALQHSITEEEFTQQLHRLLKDMQPLGARIIVLSPHELFPARPPIPSPSRYNSQILNHVDIARRVAKEDGVGFVDLFHGFTTDVWDSDRLISAAPIALPKHPAEHPDLLSIAASRWSDNGMHLNDAGYRAASRVVARRLTGMPDVLTTVRIELAAKTVTIDGGGDVRNVTWPADKTENLQFEFLPQMLSPVPTILHLVAGAGRAARLSGTVSTADATQSLIVIMTGGDGGKTSFSAGPDPQYERLRQLIVRKNQLYFYRWRPQNITYLFGFRKHEQGQNAAEIPQFDPLVKDLEDQIDVMKQPQWRNVTLKLSPE